jgi:glycosidase
MTTPYWIQDAIFYQIFPDRFADGDKANNPPNVQKWGSTPTVWGFQGGDLRGIVHHFDYLLDLGVNALYLNPIFAASSTHRYNTSDYLQIDPRLGTISDFRVLLEVAHRNNVKVVLDGVFNHCGRGFFAFNDVLENGEHSAYRDWFHINSLPLDAYGDGGPQHYAGWWNHRSLPKFNTRNPDVRRYILNVARYWIEQGADGWRLDVPNEIDDDDFWADFRRVVRSANRDAYLLGEIWDINPRWANETHFDGLMNYPVKDALLSYLLGHQNAAEFGGRIEAVRSAYRRENLYAMYVPLDSHDTERFLTLVGGDAEKLKLALLFAMAFPGAPAIYYGDEIGMEGGRDPDSRRAFPWRETAWNQDLRAWVKALIAIRKQSACLRRGEYIQVLAEDGKFAFVRTLGHESVLVAINASARGHQFDLPVSKLGWSDSQPVRNLLSLQKPERTDGRVRFNLPAWSGGWFG